MFVSWAGQPIITAFICNYDIVLTSNILVLEYTNTTFNIVDIYSAYEDATAICCCCLTLRSFCYYIIIKLYLLIC